MDCVLNDPWHALATAAKSSHFKALTMLFKKTKQLAQLVTHYNTCRRIPMNNHSTLGVRVDAGDLIEVMLLCPQQNLICHKCPVCGLLLRQE